MPQFTEVSIMAKYSKEFKLQAAKLVVEAGYSYDHATKQVGATDWSVRNWVQKYQESGELPSKAQSQPKIDEIRQLRKELKQLKLEKSKKKQRRTLPRSRCEVRLDPKAQATVPSGGDVPVAQCQYQRVL